jgi:transposase
LTGHDRGTGGNHRPGHISKQGDRVLRVLLISGASAHLRQQKCRGISDPWLRRPAVPATGLTSTPYSSWGIDREQGIGKAGDRRLRTVMVELAWLWQRYQPGTAQVAWFRERVGSTGRRLRKVMVVALARKLLIALWRFVIDGLTKPSI